MGSSKAVTGTHTRTEAGRQAGTWRGEHAARVAVSPPGKVGQGVHLRGVAKR